MFLTAQVQFCYITLISVAEVFMSEITQILLYAHGNTDIYGSVMHGNHEIINPPRCRLANFLGHLTTVFL
jgi:hypothetical protein